MLWKRKYRQMNVSNMKIVVNIKLKKNSIVRRQYQPHRLSGFRERTEWKEKSPERARFNASNKSASV